MRHIATVVAITLAAGILAGACSGDETSTSSSNSSTTTSQSNTTSATTGSSNGGSSQGGSAGGTSQAGGTGGIGQGGYGGGILGCAENPGICPENWECCGGVPYPPEGICLPECTMNSDRNAKHDITPVDSDAVLESLAALPVARWRYDAAPSSQHMGPMAQDFQAAFGLGDSDRRIAPVDANGVLMAAMQALYRRQAASERENAALRAEIAALRAELERR
ncbi:MAG TPA: tail fiber domain-containing protein [Polyangiaceae bacterium]|jgi:hypothetical protein|nr:tail fiber domain-containing protein [Polyangiaceae bacterium]